MAASFERPQKANSFYIRPVHEGFSIDSKIKVGFFSSLTEARGNGYRLLSVGRVSETSMEVVSEIFDKHSDATVTFTTLLKLIGAKDIEIQIDSYPSKVDIPNFVSGFLGVQLPCYYWKNGFISLGQTSHKISPFADGQRSLYSQTLSQFSVESVSLPKTKVIFSSSSEVTCELYDTRHQRNDWGEIELRIAQFGGESFTWGMHDRRTFRLALHFDNEISFEIENIFEAKLDIHHKKQLHEKGFVQISGLLEPRFVEQALRSVNVGIAEIGPKTSRRWDVRKNKYMGFSDSWTAKYQSTPLAPIINETKITGILADLLGQDKIPTVGGGQISLIFPDDLEYPVPLNRTGYHIDGEPNVMWNEDFDPNVKYEVPKLDAFTALVGVYLKDVMEEDNGNFALYPGSHFAHAEYFLRHGPDSILNEHGKLTMPIKIADLQPPVQLCCRAGDVIIANYLTAHTMACNIGPDIRYAIYFRVTVLDFDKHRMESLTHAWNDWPGLDDTLK